MIQDLDQDAMRRLYRKRRKAAPPKDSNGAGLGLLEMARRASKPVSYTIQPVNDSLSFCAIKAVI